MDEGFIDINKDVKLAQEEIDYIKDNPEGLTKEGVEYCLNMWKQSSNKYVIQKYKLMLTHCKNLAQSGKLSDGRTVLAKRNDKVVWSENLP